MGIDLPEEVSEYLAAPPVLGSAEQILPLFTVDEAGFPHACLLSRGQVRVVSGSVRAAVTSPGTRANLVARPKALLLVMIADTVHHCALQVDRAREDDGVLGCVFVLIGHKADSIHVPLEPMTFPATDEISQYERWTDTAAFLERL